MTTKALGILFLCIFLTYAEVIPPRLTVPEDYQSNVECGPIHRASCRSKATVRKCDILILGGGTAGPYMAWLLAKNMSVCVIEKNPVVGGRIVDTPAPFVLEGESEPRVFGLCALRVNIYMPMIRCLANRLGIQLYLAPFDTYHVRLRGRVVTNLTQVFDGGSLEGLYDLPSTWRDVEQGWAFLLGFSNYNPTTNMIDDEDYRERAKRGGEFLRYCRQQLGSEGCQLLYDTNTGFIAEFDVGYDALMYVDRMRKLYSWGSDLYPVGGMTQIPLRFEAGATSDGARFFKNETVRCVTKTGTGSNTVFHVSTNKARYEAKFFVNTLPNKQFDLIGGNFAIQVTSQPQYRFLATQEVATIAVWWSERWWEPFQSGPNVTLRSWSSEDCFNRFDFPDVPYLKHQNVTRVVYSDVQCVPFWKAAFLRGQEEVVREILNGLSQVFPEVEFPEIVKIQNNYQPNAWSYIQPFSPYSVFDMQNWASDPMPGIPFCHAGEQFNPTYSGWTEGAVDSVNRCVAKHFGFDLEELSNPCHLDNLLEARLDNEFWNDA